MEERTRRESNRRDRTGSSGSQRAGPLDSTGRGNLLSTAPLGGRQAASKLVVRPGRAKGTENKLFRALRAGGRHAVAGRGAATGPVVHGSWASLHSWLAREAAEGPSAERDTS